MSLQDLIRRKATGSIATAIPATRATAPVQAAATVAGLATVAVANSNIENREKAKSAPSAGFGDDGERLLKLRSVQRMWGADTPTARGPGAAEEAQQSPDMPGIFRIPELAEHARDEPELQGREAALHAARLNRFLAAGLAPVRAQTAADRLTVRDADYGDNRRMCAQCSHYGTRGRCIAAASGRLPGVAKDLMPIPDLLQRCDTFGLRKGLY